MFLWGARKAKKRGKTNRLRAKARAKNRRRINRMHGRPQGRKLSKAR